MRYVIVFTMGIVVGCEATLWLMIRKLRQRV